MINKITLYSCVLVAIAGFYAVSMLSAYQRGRQAAKLETLGAIIAAHQIRKEIDHETASLGPVDLCIALGGMPEECRNSNKTE